MLTPYPHPYALLAVVVGGFLIVAFLAYISGKADGYRSGWNDGWIDYRHYARGKR